MDQERIKQIVHAVSKAFEGFVLALAEERDQLQKELDLANKKIDRLVLKD